MPLPMNVIRILVADKVDEKYFKIFDKNLFIIEFKIGISNSEILLLPAKYHILIIRSTREINKQFLDTCKFKVIATCSRGTDHIDVKTAKKNKIKILYSENGNYVSTAEHTVALILAIYKKICFADKLVRSGNFAGTDFETYELKGKKIGIIGIGKVGSYVAKLASAFGMIVYANDIDREVRLKNPHLKFKSLKYIITNSDIITVHIPLNKFNENFISQKKLELLKKNSVLINTSRGKVIEEKYLLKMLKEKKIFFAGLDVFENEPFINKRFFSFENVILTNHIAGKTVESKHKIVEEILLQIKNYCTYKNIKI
jgi:D-3-phosphoglycerate dehydrogenase